MSAFPPEFKELYSPEMIAQRVAELGNAITLNFAEKKTTALVVLKGSFMFAADLLRAIDLPLNVEFIGLRSYGDRMETSGVVQITMDVKHPVANEHLIIIEDIVDTGLTIQYLMANLATRNPASIHLAALLHKPARTKVAVPINYLGFTVDDLFVVGYGLDCAGQYRNLPSIGYLDPPPTR